MGGVEDENVPLLCRVVWDFLNIFRHCFFQVMLKMRCYQKEKNTFSQ